MRAVVQRVSSASVEIEGRLVSHIDHGMLVLLGIEEDDGPEDVSWLSGKIARLRIFDDHNGVMNMSVSENGGDILVVSQFTLHASTKKGNRPSYIRAAKPEKAIPVYESFVSEIGRETGKKIQTGAFGAMMNVSLINSGPVTIFIDTKQKE
jgi:D-tyrosyl-tRNA(Tyr) deacylase